MILNLLELPLNIHTNIFNLDRAKILFKWIDLKARIKTEKAFSKSIKVKNLKLKFKEIKIIIGINFCAVESIKIVQIFNLLNNEKIQPWKGTLPNFTKSLTRIKFSSISLNVRLIQRLNNKNNAEAPL